MAFQRRLLFVICLMYTRASLEGTLIRNDNITFDRYLRYVDIQNYLRNLEQNYKDLVTLENYGHSYENRSLTLIRISSESCTKKPLIIVDAGLHAQEWLAPAQALYTINQLVQEPNNMELIENVDWVIIPLANPDGYEYTHTTDRLWRKNRSKGKICVGVDLNRNFNIGWSQLSTDECSIFYGGREPFSEPEADALGKIILRYANRTKLYISVHSAAQAFLYPFGYLNDLPENDEELRELGVEVSKAVYNVNKTEYKVGRSGEILNSGPGTSQDWAYSVANIKLAYTIEMEAYVNTSYEHRFEMPPDRILGVVSEVFEGIKVMHSYVLHKYG